jgi:hypothetical protein
MNDDIVIRLRMSADLVDGFPKAPAKNLFPKSWLSEAADEIERLREELANRKVTLEIKAVKGKNFDVNKVVETFKRFGGPRYE